MFTTIRERLRKKSLITQLTVAITALMTVILIVVITITSVRSSRDITNKIYASRRTLLDLQMKNVTAYLSQVDTFSLNPRNDVRFLKIVGAGQPEDFATHDYLTNIVRNSYYQRDDIVDYSMYLVNLNKGYSISRSSRNVSERPMTDITANPLYTDFSKPKYYRAVVPASGSGELLTCYRTIINIQDGRPLAFVRFTLDSSWFARTLDSEQRGEAVCLRDGTGRIFYLSATEDMNDAAAFLAGGNIPVPVNNTFVSMNGRQYLAVSAQQEDTGWTLTAYISKQQLDSSAAETRYIAVAAGFIFIIAAAVLLSLFVRVLMRPLPVLAEQLRTAGSGNFKTRVTITGCSEVDALSAEYNTMIGRIDELIEKNYVAEINWKNAQLAALKSQINPHFLYNTLQTISAEAIEHDEMKINDMVMALSSMLKYTIRGPDNVTLRTELDHVSDYLFLQKARFENRLTYEYVIDPDIEELPIPKISVMTLVENSIIHGMSKSADAVHIEITAAHEDNKLVITVTDDGAGMPEERLEAIRKILAGSDPHETGAKPDEPECIGLRNLSNRLKLMYGETACLHIYSTEYTGTSTVMEVQDV